MVEAATEQEIPVDKAGRPIASWFDPKRPAAHNWYIGYIMTRLYTNNNFLGLFRGPTGAGKSWSALKTAEYVDPNFTGERIVFTAKEFMGTWKRVPKRGVILWDEPGLGIGHRKWLAEQNQIIMQIFQSFRYRFVNVLFAVPSEAWIDKVVRELVHRIVDLPERLHREPPVQGTVMRMVYWRGFPSWEPLGTVDFFPPTRKLVHEYESRRKEMIEKIYERFDHLIEKVEQREVKAAEPVAPQKSIEQLVEEAKTIMPNLLHQDWEYKLDHGIDRDVINMHELQRVFDLPQTKSYSVRAELLKHLQSQRKQGEQGDGSAATG